MLVIDDTGDLKKGGHTVGVQGQYTGTARRIENSQIAVFLGYASARGRALIDRELYLPRAWTDDPTGAPPPGCRSRSASPPTWSWPAGCWRALHAGTPAGWVTADEFYGGCRQLRTDLQARGVGYVLAVARSHHVRLSAGTRRVDRIAVGP